ncbi:hypothetical protein TNCT_544681 [Trichonephila clavata]|uniref:Uncharacterized protein n=1 Tax=Trichonephila clavata TaxID=2740835 RepID=A0A8X6HLA8_TRICU|nr:hypothetical protein TNCT_544681 [Trichonephila clavata]
MDLNVRTGETQQGVEQSELIKRREETCPSGEDRQSDKNAINSRNLLYPKKRALLKSPFQRRRDKILQFPLRRGSFPFFTTCLPSEKKRLLLALRKVTTGHTHMFPHLHTHPSNCVIFKVNSVLRTILLTGFSKTHKNSVC